MIERKMDIKLSGNNIDYCYRLKNRERANRPIMVKFYRNKVQWEIYKNKIKIKSTQIVIKENLTKFKHDCVLTDGYSIFRQN